MFSYLVKRVFPYFLVSHLCLYLDRKGEPIAGFQIVRNLLKTKNYVLDALISEIPFRKTFRTSRGFHFDLGVSVYTRACVCVCLCVSLEKRLKTSPT